VTTSKKAALSLLIVVLLVGAFSGLAFSGLFDFISKEAFLFPTTMNIILFASLVLTTFLIVFLLFNLRQDPLVVIQNRLKRLQISLIEQFYEDKSDADWARWIGELEQRREEVRALLKRGVKADSRHKDTRGDIAVKDAGMDILIDKSWDELLAVLGSRRNQRLPGETLIDEERIARILERLLEARPLAPTPSTKPSAVSAAAGKTGLLNKASAIAAAIEAKAAHGTGNTESEDEIEILEELDEAEELSMSNQDEGLIDGKSNTAPPISAASYNQFASEVEFSQETEPESADVQLFATELEVVSPFSVMRFDSPPDDDTAESPPNANPEGNGENELNTDAARGLPLITTPFYAISRGVEVETLQPISDASQTQFAKEKQALAASRDVILEREGIHYISEDALAPTPEYAATLNRELKALVDAVTK